jgi:hypothetical protein
MNTVLSYLTAYETQMIVHSTEGALVPMEKVTEYVREYGFKELCEANLSEMDSVWSNFVHCEPPGEIWLGRWLSESNAIELTASTPREVRAMFEVCRGAIIYGWYFYPMLALVTEQLYRLLEMAARAKMKEIDLQSQKCSFFDAIELLGRQSVLDKKQVAAWHSLRAQRNWVSHPTIQSIIPPGRALSFAKEAADMINDLYRPTQGVAS